MRQTTFSTTAFFKGKKKRDQFLAEMDQVMLFDVCHCGTRARPLTERQRVRNRRYSRVRAIGEHPYLVVKRLWGFTKVRYRGLAKNAGRAFTALALANIYLSRHRLMGQVRP